LQLEWSVEAMSMRAKKTTKSAPVQAAVLKTLIRAFAVLPLGWAQSLGALIGWALWLMPNRLRRTTIDNLELCLPELGAEERRQIGRRSLMETGKTAAEVGAVWFWRTEKLLARIEGVEGEEYLLQEFGRKRGLLVLVPHLGNWEILSRYLQERLPVLALYRPPRIREMDEFIRQARERHGAKLVPADRSGLRCIVDTLSAGNGIGVLPDQEPLKRHGVFAPFFGVPALTMTLVARLLHRHGAIAVFGYSERTAAGGFRLRFQPAPEGLDSEDLEKAAAQLNRGVEECVRRCPEQYTWSYRRFRTRPPGEMDKAS
jgi:KDO2-lipid IV(A) lauroyltransferase